MALVESTGMQQVLSLSNVTTKAQQNVQKRVDIVNQNFVADTKVEDEKKKREIKNLEKTDESLIREEYTDQGGVKYKNRPQKREKQEGEAESQEGEKDNDGRLVDIIV